MPLETPEMAPERTETRTMSQSQTHCHGPRRTTRGSTGYECLGTVAALGWGRVVMPTPRHTIE
jgi:hypothetical protein